MKNSIAKNYIYNLIYQILVIILPVITTPYLARTLGPEGTGTYSYTISIVTYFILFGSLGIALYGQREIAFVQDDKAKRTDIFSNVFLLRCVTMILSMAIFYGVFCFSGDYRIYYRILLIEMLANIIDISWFYQGLEQFKKTATRNIIVKLLSVICIFVFIKNPGDVSKYLFIYVGTTLFGNLVLWLDLRKHIQKISFKNLSLFKHLKATIVLFIPQVAIQIYTVLDKTMIGSILNDMTEVGYYEQSQKIVKMLLTIITSLGAVMMPRIAKLYADGERAHIKEYMYRTFRFVFLMGCPLILGLISVSKNFVPLFFGEGYEPVVDLINVTSFIILFIGFSNVTGSQYLLSTKRQKEFTISVVCGAIVNATLNFILIPIYKAMGASIATVIAELTVTGVQLYFVRKDFKVFTILRSSVKYLIAALIMFAVSLAIEHFISSRMICVITQICISAIVYFVVLLILKDMLIKELINKFITSKLKRKDN